MRRANVFSVALLAVAMLTLSVGPSPARAGRPRPSVSAGNEQHAGDFYLHQGKRIPLRRSQRELGVRFEAELDERKRKDIARSLPAGAEVGELSEVREPGFAVVRLGEGAAGPELASLLHSVRAREDVRYAFPVFFAGETDTRLFLTDEILIKLKADRSAAHLSMLQDRHGMVMVKPMWGTADEYLMRLVDPKASDPLAVANALATTEGIEWAEPNFVLECRLDARPNDPQFPKQWHLENTGQGGGVEGADVQAVDAWDLEQGSPEVVIAVLDDGVEAAHEDLASAIFSNPGEIPGNGVDDDLNGYVDDVNGWDFANGDNDPNPYLNGPGEDAHGTAVAGVAAARGDNWIGVAGTCPRCTILPLKLGNSTSDGRLEQCTPERISNAIRYAASLADVVNMCFGGPVPSSAVQSAAQYAITSGRGGKGSVVLAAAGNGASGYGWWGVGSIPPGTHRFRWEYSKDGSVSVGDDTAWLGWVALPGGEILDFETGAAGWSTGGDATWGVVDDPAHADEGLCLRHAFKAGSISDGQTSYAETVRSVPAGDLSFFVWVSSERGYDGIRLFIDLDDDGGPWDFTSTLLSGVPAVQFDSNDHYPAGYPEVIAVGASSNFDCRAAYSQFGPGLDFVAPSSAGPHNLGVFTTDRTGIRGYDSGSYTTSFGGTSSATPVASGVVGLMLSANPELTQAEVRELLHATAEEVGTEPYDAEGRNDRHGSGRINAFEAVSESLATDTDEDGVPDAEDNCPHAPNSGQENADEDAHGDACECGDFNGDGFLDTTDARLIQRCSVGELECAPLCDATGEGSCDTIDARLVQRHVVGELAKEDLSCEERP